MTSTNPGLSIGQISSAIAFAGVFLAVVIGFRVWTDHQAEQPIAEPYRLFIEHLAGASTDAKAALDQYYAKHQRSTVASKHFPAVCAVMHREAKAQGARPELFSADMSYGCAAKAREFVELP